MDTYRVRVKVSKGGQLSIKGLPFNAGDEVVVVIYGRREDRQKLAQELQALFREIQSLPQAAAITEEEIAEEIAAYRAEKK